MRLRQICKKHLWERGAIIGGARELKSGDGIVLTLFSKNRAFARFYEISVFWGVWFTPAMFARYL